MSKETETLDFTHGEPLENLSITTDYRDYAKQDSISDKPKCEHTSKAMFHENAPPICQDCGEYQK